MLAPTRSTCSQDWGFPKDLQQNVKKMQKYNFKHASAEIQNLEFGWNAASEVVVIEFLKFYEAKNTFRFYTVECVLMTGVNLVKIFFEFSKTSKC